jgi:hypothetical protein
MWLSSAFGQPRRNLLADPTDVLTKTGWHRLLDEVRRILGELKELGRSERRLRKFSNSSSVATRATGWVGCAASHCNRRPSYLASLRNSTGRAPVWLQIGFSRTSSSARKRNSGAIWRRWHGGTRDSSALTPALSRVGDPGPWRPRRSAGGSRAQDSGRLSLPTSPPTPLRRTVDDPSCFLCDARGTRRHRPGAGSARQVPSAALVECRMWARGHVP